MAISKSQHRSSSLGSCNINPSSSSSRNRNNKVLALPSSSSSMLFVLLAVIFMLATGLAEPYESTTMTAEIESPYTEVVKQDLTNFQFKTAADDLEDDNFGSLSEGGLEQDIRDAVKSEVESEIEAGAFDFVLARRDEHSMTPDHIIVTHRDDKDDRDEVVTNSREAKTLETIAVAKEESTESPEPAAEAESETKLETLSDNQTAESRHRPLPNITSDLVSVIFNEDRAITEQPITTTNLLALEQQHKDLELRDTTPSPYIYDPPKHQVTKKQGVEDLLPVEPPVVPEAEDDFDREERKLEPETNALLEPVAVTHLPDIEENIIVNDEDPQPETELSNSPKPLVNVERDEADPESKVEPETEATSEAGAEVPENAVESDNKSVVQADKDIEGAEETTVSVDRPAKTTTELNYVAESSTDVVYEDETTTKTVEEEEKPIKNESIDRADDSTGTATPLVSYPPHDADQTFDSNLADERTAHLSLSSTSRSTLIIALCSGTAVIFIIISLVIFVVSFQRQHGTLDIEMQEQRLGKDSLDEEDAQLKLLDVDLSAPAILVSMGNEETDECL